MTVLASMSPNMVFFVDFVILKGFVIALVAYDLYRTDRMIKNRKAEKAAKAKEANAEVITLPRKQPSDLKEAA